MSNDDVSGARMDETIKRKIDRLLHDTIITLEDVKNCVLHKNTYRGDDKRTAKEMIKEARDKLDVLHFKLRVFRHSTEFELFLRQTNVQAEPKIKTVPEKEKTP